MLQFCKNKCPHCEIITKDSFFILNEKKKNPISPNQATTLKYGLKITSQSQSFPLRRRLSLCVTRLKAVEPVDPRLSLYATCTNTAEDQNHFQPPVLSPLHLPELQPEKLSLHCFEDVFNIDAASLCVSNHTVM